MQTTINFQFEAEIWKYASAAAWHFVSLPQELAVEIRTHLKAQEEGWGRMKARATIGNSTWDTAIWYDSKMKTYLLPIKASVRKKESLCASMKVRVQIGL